MTSCSGDDTEVEVIQKQEVIESESMEEVIPEPEPKPEPDFEYFGTLESWGAEDGLINIAKDNAGNCEDDLFTKQHFPPFPINVEQYIHPDSHEVLDGVGCNKNLFKLNGSYDWKFRDGRRDNLNRKTSLVFVKTGSNSDRFSGGNNLVVGGKVYAKFNANSSEYNDRGMLYEECGPENIENPTNELVGDWRATKDTNKVQLCVRFDSLPGAVKCYEEDSNTVDDMGTIRLFKGTDVEPLPVPVTIPQLSGGNAWTLFNSSGGGSDFMNIEKLCYLFDGGI